MPIRENLDDFLRWCRRHRAAGTVVQFASRLRSFVAAFGDRDLRLLRPVEVDRWLEAIGRYPDGNKRAGQEKAPDTISGYAVAFESFQSWALLFKELDAKILDRIEKPRGRLREKLPTSAETERILQHATPEFALIYRSLRQSAARPGELAATTVADVDREPGFLVLDRHKTARETGEPRRIPIGTKLRQMIEEAIGGRDRTDPAVRAQPIFHTPRGRAWTQQNLSRTFQRLRERAGLPEHLLLYLTRHEHLTKICRERGLLAAARAAGHKRTTTTERYVKTAAEELQANQDLVD